MITLSILQPYAWLIVNGHKDIENRTWSTGRRSEFLVHAGKTYTRRAHETDTDILWIHHRIKLPPFEQIALGGIVGQSEIVDCVQSHPSRWKQVGTWGFVLRNSKPLPFTPWRGQLGWFDVPIEQLRPEPQAGGLFA
jgi:hypothetical protein